jgi:hypothetical protein
MRHLPLQLQHVEADIGPDESITHLDSSTERLLENWVDAVRDRHQPLPGVKSSARFFTEIK